MGDVGTEESSVICMMCTVDPVIRVAIVEDDRAIAAAWQSIIDHSPGMQCVGSYLSVEDARPLLARLSPHIILMDIGLPGQDGITFTKEVKEKLPAVEVVICTIFMDTDQIVQALQAGASGYLLKSATPDEVVAAIRTARSGGSPIDSRVARRIIGLFRPGRETLPQPLTKREEDILHCVSKGYRNKEIAAELFISIDTVRAHVRNIYGKLEVNSRIDAVRKYYGGRPI